MKQRDPSRLSFNTLCVHGSGGADPATGAVSTPIYQSSTFAFGSAEEGAAIFAGEQEGYFYTRLGNPTQAAFEREMAFLERGEAALATGSGMAATTTAVLSLVRAGDNLVAAHTLYGGTHKLFNDLLPRFGIEARTIDANDPEALARAVDSKTRLLFVETPANPTLSIVDLRLCARECRRHGIPLIVDNTFATPYYQRPLELGADVVIHSATKYIGGHGDTVAGVIVGTKDFVQKARFELIRDLGGILSPFNAWLLLRGLKTLPVRMERHSENAMQIAQFLNFHPKVARLWYPGLRTHPQHEIAAKQMTGFGGMLAFELKGGRKAGVTLLNSVELMTLAVSLGDCDTLIEHPASMTHSTYSSDELAAVGITDGLVRLSVGIEGVQDLIADLDQALARVAA
ncbi:MAG TPA: aminotransferase class I/II-fold pyridoxal phosphate-dependent enzyme [Candidatus Eisenbacteria bacterium]|nr:aminotransferase class I/II-fold pyridoxal phosphate-dependent enzyme [Candidatus Eisenbacteria bacterium]